ncbi:hypothetical protein [Capnocytophaga felis]|uniref:Uncharacterized protein n=1 Tax=Capnocytophaga felis TaxID=2267611 RepID=A0A5M4BBA3_9FLAO|nr:hypothetical protein [Capnocytophaga felis]GET46517.1 hypothetical protein RCZ01_18190 [Capnocytophaga felis]GET48407.1 hypothetical protein RCZ02_12380 [Capnocytophaga felis]
MKRKSIFMAIILSTITYAQKKEIKKPEKQVYIVHGYYVPLIVIGLNGLVKSLKTKGLKHIDW